MISNLCLQLGKNTSKIISPSEVAACNSKKKILLDDANSSLRTVNIELTNTSNQKLKDPQQSLEDFIKTRILSTNNTDILSEELNVIRKTVESLLGKMSSESGEESSTNFSYELDESEFDDVGDDNKPPTMVSSESTITTNTSEISNPLTSLGNSNPPPPYVRKFSTEMLRPQKGEDMYDALFFEIDEKAKKTMKKEIIDNYKKLGIQLSMYYRPIFNLVFLDYYKYIPSNHTTQDIIYYFPDAMTKSIIKILIDKKKIKVSSETVKANLPEIVDSIIEIMNEEIKRGGGRRRTHKRSTVSRKTRRNIRHKKTKKTRKVKRTKATKTAKRTKKTRKH